MRFALTRTSRTLTAVLLIALLGAACAAPAASPTAPPAKPTEAPKPAPPAPAAPPPAAPAAVPALSPVASPAASPAAAASAKPAAPSFDAKAVEDFYRGKTIRIVTGFTPGGLYDGWSRLLAKHMPKHIPGSPGIIVENMAGAASLTAANHLYNAAPKDGTVIGSFSQALILNQITGGEGVNLDMAKFEWLGAVSNVVVACLARDEVGVAAFKDVIPPTNKRVVLGTSAPGSTGYDYPLVASKLTDANFKIVTGYPGNAEVRLAIEKSEVDGYCVAREVLKPTLKSWDDSGVVKYKIFLQLPPEGTRHAEMSDVPVIWDYLKSPEDKAVVKLMIAPEQFMWPFALPPGTPPDRVAALRKAMFDAFNDPDLNADAQKASWDKRPVSGEKILQVLKEVIDTPEALKSRFKELYRAKP